MKQVYKVRRISDGLFFKEYRWPYKENEYDTNGRTFSSKGALKCHLPHVKYNGPHEVVTFELQEVSTVPIEDFE